MSIELKQCPFCARWDVKLTTADNGYEHYVGCGFCGARGPEYDFDNGEPDFSQVTAAWNTRTSDHRVNTYDQIVEALSNARAMLDACALDDPDDGFQEAWDRGLAKADAALEAAKRGGGDAQ